MDKKRKLYWIVAILLAFVVLSGGCGGSGGNESGGSNPNPNPGPGPTPPPSANDFVALSGTWIATQGSGKVNSAHGAYDASLRLGTLRLTLLNTFAGSTTATFQEYADFDWDIFVGGRYLDDSDLRDDDHVNVTVTKKGNNVFSYVTPHGNSVEITLTSLTTAQVTESGTLYDDGVRYSYSVNYSLRKN